MERRNTYKILVERGFIYQCTDETGLSELFDQETVTAYIGFDITAESLHVGHMLPLMALGWMDRTGHRPIALMGSGTTMVGDPSGRTESRKIMSRETILRNMEGIRVQASRFISLGEGGRALMEDNGDWLMGLNYLAFLREIGRHFSINRMLSAESYKSRLEAGLTFLEFNYMVMQAYDFLELYRKLGNKLQMGGQDQWGNIVAGIDLIRRADQGEAFGATIPLLMDPKTGEKFGKTNAGAVWLDKSLTSVYDFYQFWRNVDDQEVGRLLNLFTFMDLEETRYLAERPGGLINRAKEILAYEVTALIHGHEEAAAAWTASVKTFGQADPKGEVKTSSAVAKLAAADAGAEIPSVSIPLAELEALSLADLFAQAGLADSKGEARRLIRQGGAYLDEVQVTAEAENESLKGAAWLASGACVIRAGKKRYRKVLVG